MVERRAGLRRSANRHVLRGSNQMQNFGK